uniref:Uncharacterized protein n=1 Tax=Rhipicephalus zambeziensis TaxID=60191 RepID=A0A224YAI5_9ACAR
MVLFFRRKQKTKKTLAGCYSVFRFVARSPPCKGVTMMPKSNNRAATEQTKNIVEKEKKNPRGENVHSVALKGDCARNEKQSNDASKEKKPTIK